MPLDLERLFEGCKKKLNDERLYRNLLAFGQVKSEHPQTAPYALAGTGDPRRVSRFFSNPRVRAEDLVASAANAFLPHACASSSTLYLLSDSTDLVHSVKRAEHVGVLSNPSLRGLRLHNAFLVGDQGQSLGLMDSWMWYRTEESTSHTRQTRPFLEKESARWLHMVEAMQKRLREQGYTGRLVSLADAECDIHEFYEACQAQGFPFLVRLCQNRRTEDGLLFSEVLPRLRVRGRLNVETWQIPEGGKEAQKRTARLSVRFGTVTLSPSCHHRGKESRKPVTLSVIEASEKYPPKGYKGVVWRLGSGEEVSSFFHATRLLRAYSWRSRIEEFHFLLKSGGMGVEETKWWNQHGELERYAALCATLAARALVLRDASRMKEQRSCEEYMERKVWQAAYFLRFQSASWPKKPPTLALAIRWIAELGNVHDRKDRPPGLLVIRRGLERLASFFQDFQLLSKVFGLSLFSDATDDVAG